MKALDKCTAWFKALKARRAAKEKAKNDGIKDKAHVSPRGRGQGFGWCLGAEGTPPESPSSSSSSGLIHVAMCDEGASQTDKCMTKATGRDDGVAIMVLTDSDLTTNCQPPSQPLHNPELSKAYASAKVHPLPSTAPRKLDTARPPYILLPQQQEEEQEKEEEVEVHVSFGQLRLCLDQDTQDLHPAASELAITSAPAIPIPMPSRCGTGTAPVSPVPHPLPLQLPLALPQGNLFSARAMFIDVWWLKTHGHGAITSTRQDILDCLADLLLEDMLVRSAVDGSLDKWHPLALAVAAWHDWDTAKKAAQASFGLDTTTASPGVPAAREGGSSPIPHQAQRDQRHELHVWPTPDDRPIHPDCCPLPLPGLRTRAGSPTRSAPAVAGEAGWLTGLVALAEQESCEPLARVRAPHHLGDSNNEGQARRRVGVRAKLDWGDEPVTTSPSPGPLMGLPSSLPIQEKEEEEGPASASPTPRPLVEGLSYTLSGQVEEVQEEEQEQASCSPCMGSPIASPAASFDDGDDDDDDDTASHVTVAAYATDTDSYNTGASCSDDSCGSVSGSTSGASGSAASSSAAASEGSGFREEEKEEVEEEEEEEEGGGVATSVAALPVRLDEWLLGGCCQQQGGVCGKLTATASPKLGADWDTMASYYVEQQLYGQDHGSGVLQAVHQYEGGEEDKPVCLRVCIKFYQLNTRTHGGLSRIMNEIRIMERCPHPCSIELYGAFMQCGYVIIVMEHAPHGSLHAALNMYPHGMPEDQAVQRFLRPTLLGLETLHNMGVVHRDIKPENLLLAGEDGHTIKLCDYGLAYDAMCGTHHTLPQDCVGTLGFQAPEVLKCGKERGTYDERADLFSLGVTLLEVLLGHLPFWVETDSEMLELFDKGGLTLLPTLLEQGGVIQLPGVEWSPPPVTEGMTQKEQFKVTSWHNRLYVDRLEERMPVLVPQDGARPLPVLSAEAKDLILSLMDRDPDNRPSATDLLSHPLLQRHAPLTTRTPSHPPCTNEEWQQEEEEVEEQEAVVGTHCWPVLCGVLRAQVDALCSHTVEQRVQAEEAAGQAAADRGALQRAVDELRDQLNVMTLAFVVATRAGIMA